MFNLDNNKNRAVLFVSGIIIFSLGIALIVKSEIGAGAWDAVNIGAGEKIGLTAGSTAFLIAIIMTILAKFIRNEEFRVNTLITAFILSIGIDFWLFTLGKITISDEFVIKSIVFIVGIILLAFGVSVYLIPKFPVNSIDDCTLAIHERFGITIGKAKLCMDFIGLGLAILLSGPVGFGTVIVTVSLGPLIDFFTIRLNKVIICRML